MAVSTNKCSHQLPTCLPLPEISRATGEDTPGLSKSKPNQKSGHSAPASRERWQGGASRVHRKDRHSTPLSLVSQVRFTLSSLRSSYNPNGNGDNGCS